MGKFYFLQNDEVGLRRIEPTDDLSNYHKWFNDQDVNEFNSHAIYPMTLHSIQEYLRGIDNSNLHLSVYLKSKDTHIGNISLQSIDYINRSAELAIIIGEKAVWGKGYSTSACELIIRHGFERMNLNRIYCGTSELNIGMQKLALRVGMTFEGRRIKALFHRNKYVDMLEYGILNNVTC